MFYIADLHVHSHYSRATSKNLNLESLYQWARIKGIHVVGTGDFTHPKWYQELKDKLEPDGSGLYRLKNPPANVALPGIKPQDIDVRFCLTTEISSIYKKGDKVRKNHNLLYAPDLDTVAKISAKLAKIGNLEADGRPILGLPARDLLEIVLESSEQSYLIPAHIWTPWFSTLGSKSGYDSIDACFEDLSEHIFAVETGLSSDPEMNWRLSQLDRFTLISNSDAHSPQKLGREANLLNTERSYKALFDAFKTGQGFLGTYEFFPEEGKYHLDGHRKCNVVLEPQETLKYKGICPACKKPLTVGVLHRVEKLADRPEPIRPEKAADFQYIIPLPEVIGEIKGQGPNTKGVLQNYQQVISAFGNEFNVLHQVPIEDIHKKFGIVLSEAVRRIREQEVKPQSGFDGQYGVIRVFEEGEMQKLEGQLSFFMPKNERQKYQKTYQAESFRAEEDVHEAGGASSLILNEAQQKVQQATHGITLVKAGPGTGKTRTLIHWISHILENKLAVASEIMAVTFTNKAAQELKERLVPIIGDQVRDMTVGTFHSIAYHLLKEIQPDWESIYDEANRQIILQFLYPDFSTKEIKQISRALGQYFDTGKISSDFEIPLHEIAEKYQTYLEARKAYDLSFIVGALLKHWRDKPEILEQTRARFQYLAVDEVQDLNKEQYAFLSLLGKTKNLLAIGDPDQAIYGFRGAEVQLFFNFKEDFQAQEINLEQNYRSTEVILKAAHQVIQHNQLKSNLKLISRQGGGAKIKLFRADDSTMEAKYILSQIEQYLGGVSNLTTTVEYDREELIFSDIAILFRERSILKPLLEQFQKQGIPFHFGEEKTLLSEAPFNLIADILRLYLNPQDLVSLHSFLKQGLAWDKKQINQLLGQLNETDLAWDKLQQVSSLPKNWLSFQTFYQNLPQAFQKQGLEGALKEIFEKYIPDDKLEGHQLLDKEAILEAAREAQADPEYFLEQMTLDHFSDTGRARREGIHLLTFHAAKGLEFPVVFLAGLEEGVSPSAKEDTNLEEERRLFYVGLTRAQQEVQITYAAKRQRFGKWKVGQISRFVTEISPKLIENVAVRARKKTKKKKAEEGGKDQLSLF